MCIRDSVNNKGVFQVVGICDCYATKAAREAEKESMNTILVSIGTESLVDVHGQVYTNLKSKFENTTDDN